MQNEIYNEDCNVTMERMVRKRAKVDLILTSPPYNTNKKVTNKTLNDAKFSGYPHLRYDTVQDVMTDSEYISFILKTFWDFRMVLKKKGVVLFNMSYGSENTELMSKVVADIIRGTDFALADIIVWKKSSAMPNNVSPNRLTRITEFIYVFVQRASLKTFVTNKRQVSVRPNGQSMYENIFNYIEAKNNDGACSLNKATFSSDLVTQLLNIYALPNSLVYDPFMGTGTTAIGCLKCGHRYLGSEISKAQCEFAEKRIKEFKDACC